MKQRQIVFLTRDGKGLFGVKPEDNALTIFWYLKVH